MKVLYFKYDWTIVDDDIIHGLRDIGAEVEILDVITGGGTRSQTLFMDEITHRVYIFHPDIVMCTNEYALDEGGYLARLFAHYRIPVVMWYIDKPPVAEGKKSQKFLKEATLVFVTDRVYIDHLRHQGFPHAFWMPLGANPERTRAPLANPDLPPMFVGALEMKKIAEIESRLINAWPDMREVDRVFIEGAVEYYRVHRLADVSEAIEALMAETGLSLDLPMGAWRDLERFIEFEASLRQRLSIILGLQDLGIVAVGETTWRDMLGSEHHLPSVTYGSEALINLYNRALCQINITKYQLKKGVTQRVFDVPLAGGICLTDRRDDVYLLFDVPAEIDVFETLDDLRRQIVGYKAEPLQRLEKIRRAKRRVEEQHLYRHRLQDIFATVRTCNVSFNLAEDDPLYNQIKPYLPKPQIEVHDRLGAILLTKPGDLLCEDIMWGLRQSGVAVSLFNAEIRDRGGQRQAVFDIKRLKGMLGELKPDFVISNNGLGVDMSGSIPEVLSAQGIPFVTWYTDEPNLVETEGSLKYHTRGTLVFCFDRVYISALQERGFAYVGHLPLGVNTDRFHPAQGEALADVIFVGSTGIKQIEEIRVKLERMGVDPQAINPSIEELVRLYLKNWSAQVEEVFKGHYHGRSLPEEALGIVYAWIELRAGQSLRVRLLSQLKGEHLRIIGEQAWKSIFEEKYYAGEIPYKGHNLAGVYSAYSIVLNISRPQLKTAVNQRVYDVPACGGFLLTDMREELSELFAEGEMAIYTYDDDLAAKVRYYLTRPDARRRMALAARQKIVANHTYVHRIRTILEVVLQHKKACEGRSVYGKTVQP